jgi:predicted O-methyltransferase YrrM
LSPGVSELGALAAGMYADSAALFAGAAWSTAALRGDALAALANEHKQRQVELEERYRLRQLAFPTAWAVEAETSLLLYALVRAFQPAAVIEMGVGNGQSSYYILRALQANGAGRLHSFDIVPEAGGLLSEGERALWDFRLIDRWRGGRSLLAQLATLPQAELCFHDAGHGYLSQFFEFGCLWEKLTDRGILVSDDVDLSYGLIDFCRLDGKHPDVLIDCRKAVGVLQRRPKASSATQPEGSPAAAVHRSSRPVA